MALKYEILSETKTVDSHILHRIKALRDISILGVNFPKGTLGGWIESPKNLSQEGNCWISTNACVFEDAEVSGNAAVFGKSIVCGNAKVKDDVLICYRARVEGNAFAYDFATIIGNSKVSGNAEISGYAFVAINAIVTDKAFLGGFAQASNNAVIEGNARIYGKVWGNSRVCDNAIVTEKGFVKGDSYIGNDTVINEEEESKIKLDLTQKTGPAKPFTGARIILGAKLPKNYKENLIAQEDEKYQKMLSEWLREKDPERNMQLRRESLAYWAKRREELGIKDPEDEEDEKRKREEEERKQREIAQQKHIQWVNEQIANKAVPVKHVLYCNYPGLEFRTEIEGDISGESYLDDPDGYWEELYDDIDDELSYQGLEKLLDIHYTEDDVCPDWQFNYSELALDFQQVPTHNEDVKIYLDSINEDGEIIDTEEVDIMEFFDRHPDYFEEGGMYDATNEYISASISKFVKESRWHFALQNGKEIIEDVKKWVPPKKDGLWVNEDGSFMYPVVWFGLEGEDPEDLWTLDGNNMDFWFNEDSTKYYLDYNWEGHIGCYEGYLPDMKAIREKCPILIEADDTPDSIDEKIQAFFIEQYKKANS